MMLSLNRIRLDGGTQTRHVINPRIVEEYAESMRAGAKFPPVVVFHDGEHYWMADGFHRHHAHAAVGAEDIDAEVRAGTCADAIWFACSANATHGLRRTNADKRCAVTAALRHPSSANLSDRAIAEHCGVDHKTVAAVRVALAGGEIPQPRQRAADRAPTLDVGALLRAHELVLQLPPVERRRLCLELLAELDDEDAE